MDVDDLGESEAVALKVPDPEIDGGNGLISKSESQVLTQPHLKRGDTMEKLFEKNMERSSL